MISSSCSATERTRPCVVNDTAGACEWRHRRVAVVKGQTSIRRWQRGEGLTSEIDPIRCSAFSAGSASHSSTLILIRSGTENTAAPAGPYAADAGLAAAAAASSAALPVASVGSSTARLVSVPRRNGGRCGPRASASVTVKSMACALSVGGGVSDAGRKYGKRVKSVNYSALGARQVHQALLCIALRVRGIRERHI